MWPNNEDITELDSIVCGMHFSVYDQAIYIAFHNGDIIMVHLDSPEEEVNKSNHIIYKNNIVKILMNLYRLKPLDRSNLRSNVWNGVRMKN